MTFGRKILIFTFILLPVLLITAYSFYQTRRQLISKVYEDRRTLTALSTAMLTAKLDHVNDLGLSLATRPLFQDNANKKKWDEAVALMTEVPKNFPFVSHVFIADTSGNIMAGIPAKQNTVYKKETGADWYKGVSKNWTAYISEVYKRTGEKHIVTALAVPVKNNSNQLTAILILEVSVPAMLQWSGDVSIGKSGFVYIVDQKGHIAANPDYSQADSVIDYSSVPAVQKALQGQTGTEILYNPIVKEKRLSSYQQVPGYKWAIIVQQQATTAMFVSSSLRTFLFFYGFIILLAVIFAWIIIKEIIRRKKTEMRLSTYADMVDNTHVVIRGIDDRVQFWNKGMEELYGWKKDEVIGKNIHQLFATQFLQPLFQIKEQLLTYNQWQGELKHTHKDGHIIHVSSHWYLHRDANGNPSAVIETNNDITALKKAEEKLRQSEESIHVLIDNVKDYAIFMLDAAGKIVSWNNGAEHIKGYTENEILGKTLDIFYSKEDVELGEPFHNLEMTKEYGHHEAEGWRLRKDGTKFWANVVFTALKNEDGIVYGYSKITRDITERKKAQEETEFLLRQINQSNDAIYTLNADRKVKTWNKGAENLYGFTQQEMLGKEPNEILKTAIGIEEIDVLVQKVHKDDYLWTELKRTTKAGNDIYVSVSTTTVKNETGKVIGYVSVNVDITLQKELLLQVNHLANLVEQSTDAIFSRDLNQHILSWNQGAEKLFGYTKQEVLGKTATELGFVQLSNQKIQEVQLTIVEHGMWQEEMNFYHKDGSSFYGAVTANVTKNDKGGITSFYFMIKDISLRKKLEEQLQLYNKELEQKVAERTAEILKNEKRFRSLIENNYDIISLMDESFNIIYRSPSATRAMGWTNEEVEKKDVTADIHPGDMDYVQMVMQQVQTSHGKAIKTLFRNRHKNGNYLWLEGTVVNLLNDSSVKAILFNFRDVTERIKAEEKLTSSELRFRSLIENSAEGISLLDAASNIIYRSPSADKILGNNPKENTISLAHPNNLQNFKDKFAEALSKPGEAVPYQVHYLHSNGNYFWAEGTFTNLLHLKAVEAVVANFHDVTERIEAEEKLKASEEQFRHSLDSMLEGVQIISFDWKYIYVNDALCRQGKYPKEELIGYTMMEKYPGIEETSLFNNCKQCFEERISIHLENEFTFPDGSAQWFELSLQPVPEGIFILSIDITERKQAEEGLKELNTELENRVHQRTDELRRANEEMEAFSYSVSHDLRAPLRAIIGFAAILEEDYTQQLDDEAKRITGIIKNNTTKMGNLIDDLLTFSRMGRQDLLKINVDSNQMVHEVKEMLNNTKNNGQKIQWQIQQLPAVNADVSTMRQVWVNLLSNAFKYSSGNPSPLIEVGTYNENGQIVFYVKDNGVGFDEKYKSKLFKVFQRLHNADEFEGTGIGLAIVDKIISKHGGKVWAEAAINKGASFYFSLPED